jgi:hypothetical protein
MYKFSNFFFPPQRTRFVGRKEENVWRIFLEIPFRKWNIEKNSKLIALLWLTNFL